MKPTHPYPRPLPARDGTGIASHAGGILLTETIRATGLDTHLTRAQTRWHKPRARHHPAKTCTDLALAVALGGDHLSDTALLRHDRDLYGTVASDPTVSRTIAALAARPEAAIDAIRTARAHARRRAWALAGTTAPPDGQGRLIIDIDATLLTAHSDKEGAAPTWKHTSGFHPLCAFVDHGRAGTGEPLAVLLRPGNAAANTAADHITVTAAALRQLPAAHRRGRKTLVRTDSGGGTRAFLAWLTKRGRWLSYSVGMTITEPVQAAIDLVPATAWTPAYDADGQVRPGAFLAEVTDLADRSGWPAGMRLIVRKEPPIPERRYAPPTPTATG